MGLYEEFFEAWVYCEKVFGSQKALVTYLDERIPSGGKKNIEIIVRHFRNLMYVWSKCTEEQQKSAVKDPLNILKFEGEEEESEEVAHVGIVEPRYYTNEEGLTRIRRNEPVKTYVLDELFRLPGTPKFAPKVLIFPADSFDYGQKMLENPGSCKVLEKLANHVGIAVLPLCILNHFCCFGISMEHRKEWPHFLLEAIRFALKSTIWRLRKRTVKTRYSDRLGFESEFVSI